MNIYAQPGQQGIFIFLAILGAAAIIALVSFLIYRYLHPKIKVDKQITEEEIAEEELNRVLEPIEDDEVAQEVADYVEEEDE